MNTIALDPDTWDLYKDADGNIAMLTGAIAQAQDAASQILLFKGELWYDTTQGIPYFATTLGRLPPLSLVRAQDQSAALMVPGVVSAQVFFSSFVNRTLQGQVQIENDSGQTAVAHF